MNSKCYPATTFPHLSRLYGAYLDVEERAGDEERAALSRWYPALPGQQPGHAAAASSLADAEALAEAIGQSAVARHYGPEALANLQRLRTGSRAVITGQQAGLFGGPLLTLLKAASAVARAGEMERQSGVPHVPVFWVAGEDHDLAEANQATFAGSQDLEKLQLEGLNDRGGEAGSVPLGESVHAALEQAATVLSYAPVVELLNACYGLPEATLGSAFAAWMTRLFAAQGLVVVDPSTRPFHALGRSVFRYALEHADELQAALLDRSAELVALGFHAQVLVKPGGSLLFLLLDGVRLPLRRTGGDTWKAGSRQYTTAELLGIVDTEPERLSPNALLRPVFQDTLFSTAAYVGGPAEIAYFAQSEVVYRAILGRVTPVLPRFSATVVEAADAKTMARFELELPDLVAAGTHEVLAQRLGARSMPVEAKRKLSAAGNALDEALGELTRYMEGLDAGLGRSASVAASKMRYQMNRQRRLMANFELQRQGSLGREAARLMLHLYPDGHPQERVLAGAQILAGAGEDFLHRVAELVEAARDTCPGHAVLLF